jgi:hypothetical protein
MVLMSRVIGTLSNVSIRKGIFTCIPLTSYRRIMGRLDADRQPFSRRMVCSRHTPVSSRCPRCPPDFQLTLSHIHRFRWVSARRVCFSAPSEAETKNIRATHSPAFLMTLKALSKLLDSLGYQVCGLHALGARGRSCLLLSRRLLLISQIREKQQ